MTEVNAPKRRATHVVYGTRVLDPHLLPESLGALDQTTVSFSFILDTINGCECQQSYLIFNIDGDASWHLTTTSYDTSNYYFIHDVYVSDKNGLNLNFVGSVDIGNFGVNRTVNSLEYVVTEVKKVFFGFILPSVRNINIQYSA